MSEPVLPPDLQITLVELLNHLPLEGWSHQHSTSTVLVTDPSISSNFHLKTRIEELVFMADRKGYFKGHDMGSLRDY